MHLRRAACCLAALLLLLAGQAQGVKLKIQSEECISHLLEMYEPFYGSFVSLPDKWYYHTAAYRLTITSPSGTKVHETAPAIESKYHLVPYETGRYRFCITLDRASTHYVADREVAWELHIGHGDYTSDHAKEHDTQSLWHYVHMVDAQIQQLRSTVSYLYWRERRHRMTVESTNRRVMWYGIGRSLLLVAVSVLQVMGVRYLFRSK